ncbi:hypothetical protein L2E81_15845 [Planktothrix agardhii 1033]|nr:hypothetical protein [Planktothrix agardhii 1033]
MNSIEENLDALAAVVEIYEDLGRALPLNLCVADANHSLWLETLVVERNKCN